MWNHRHIVFSVDDFPIRVFKNNEEKGVPYPKMQPMGVYSTLWEADNWTTRGGLEKINWSKAPFYVYYKDFDIEGCVVPGAANCASNLSNWWEGATYQALNVIQARRYRWVRLNHLIYDYCQDKSALSAFKPEIHIISTANVGKIITPLIYIVMCYGNCVYIVYFYFFLSFLFVGDIIYQAADK